MKILLDVDGVLADFAGAFLKILNRQTGRKHRESDVTSFAFGECVCPEPLEEAAVWDEVAATPALVGNLDEYPGAMAALESLRAKHEVLAVTTPNYGCPRWMWERRNWLVQRGFSDHEIVFCHDKSLIKGDILIDDHPAHVAKYGDGGRLVKRPWNKGTKTLEAIVKELCG